MSYKKNDAEIFNNVFEPLRGMTPSNNSAAYGKYYIDGVDIADLYLPTSPNQVGADNTLKKAIDIYYKASGTDMTNYFVERGFAPGSTLRFSSTTYTGNWLQINTANLGIDVIPRRLAVVLVGAGGGGAGGAYGVSSGGGAGGGGGGGGAIQFTLIDIQPGEILSYRIGKGGVGGGGTVSGGNGENSYLSNSNHTTHYLVSNGGSGGNISTGGLGGTPNGKNGGNGGPRSYSGAAGSNRVTSSSLTLRSNSTIPIPVYADGGAAGVSANSVVSYGTQYYSTTSWPHYRGGGGGGGGASYSSGGNGGANRSNYSSVTNESSPGTGPGAGGGGGGGGTDGGGWYTSFAVYRVPRAGAAGAPGALFIYY